MVVNIYALCEPGTTMVRYIGKTRQKATQTAESSLKERLQRHFYARNIKKDTYMRRWLRLIASQGQKPDIMLIDIGDEHTWQVLEVFHIASHRQAGYRLTNVTNGGEGCSGFKHTSEHLAYMSRTLTGRKRTPEQRARMSAAHKGSPSWRKGKKAAPGQVSPLKGRPLSDEQRLKLSIAKKGKIDPTKHEIVTCAYCGTQFEAKTCAKRKYCSNDCTAKGKHYQVTRLCHQCGKEYTTQPTLRFKFCSNECRFAYNRGKPRTRIA